MDSELILPIAIPGLIVFIVSRVITAMDDARFSRERDDAANQNRPSTRGVRSMRRGSLKR
ncbi:MAG: hypothetical protein KDI42_08025 [Gammaproteobacteria bacterium]|nr:hypothetical protein [Gammaproteobacteria bacterium]